MNANVTTDFGRNLKVLRAYRGLTQGALAKRLRVAQATVWEWEHNVSRPLPDKVPNLCAALGCKPAALDAAGMVTLAMNLDEGFALSPVSTTRQEG